jgi:hypothetical protein
MSEPEVATKAPESDVAVSGVSAAAEEEPPPAYSGPNVSEHCVTDRPTRQFLSD